MERCEALLVEAVEVKYLLALFSVYLNTVLQSLILPLSDCYVQWTCSEIIDVVYIHFELQAFLEDLI
jgi:hypothetical protein